ncbi:MAG: ketol-acid reductoisomerase [Lachnospiraceae bacterium]|nr:ketol-acid reductoisomerase [Lachnospiraceae bacterium]
MAKIYYDQDADLNLVKDKCIALLGYGNQGRSQALNMRDSGVTNIVIGNRRDESYEQAKTDGFHVCSIEEAVSQADIIFVLLPDEACPEIYNTQMKPYFKKGVILNFASGYNLTFHNIELPADSDVVMAAPRMLGQGVREMYLSGEGYPAFVAVAQDASGMALEYGKAICKAIGATRKGAIEGKIDDETFLDLMTELGVLPLVYKVFAEAFRLEVEMGHPEEAVLTEAYLSKEMAFLWEQAAERGLFRQLCLHSHTAQYAQLKRFEEIDSSMIRSFLKDSYDSIKSGTFNEEWQNEQKTYHLEHLEQLRQRALDTEVTKAEDSLRERLGH